MLPSLPNTDKQGLGGSNLSADKMFKGIVLLLGQSSVTDLNQVAVINI